MKNAKQNIAFSALGFLVTALLFPSQTSAISGSFFSLSGNKNINDNIALPYTANHMQIADLGNDGVAEIIISGDDKRIHVLRNDGSEIFSFPEPKSRVGSIAIADWNNDANNDIIIGSAIGQPDKVSIYFTGKNPSLITLLDPCAECDGGLGVVFINHHLFTVPLTKYPTHLNIYEKSGAIAKRALAFSEKYTKGITITTRNDEILITKTDGSQKTLVIDSNTATQKTIENTPPKTITITKDHHEPDPQLPQQIIVDYSEQRLYAYENGLLIKTFLVSTGRDHSTPMGHFPISAKPYIVHYAGTGYDMGYVPYNLRFQPHIYIHYAPWHNNFGRQWSRGCVNVNLESAKWIYNWAEVGTMVSVIE